MARFFQKLDAKVQINLCQATDEFVSFLKFMDSASGLAGTFRPGLDSGPKRP
jgi:hypothetical protein